MSVPPAREELPTLPCDLSEYARRETGPRSWSAASDVEPTLVLDDPFDDLTAWVGISMTTR
jgi:hypothetical protein